MPNARNRIIGRVCFYANNNVTRAYYSRRVCITVSLKQYYCNPRGFSSAIRQARRDNTQQTRRTKPTDSSLLAVLYFFFLSEIVFDTPDPEKSSAGVFGTTKIKKTFYPPKVHVFYYRLCTLFLGSGPSPMRGNGKLIAGNSPSKDARPNARPNARRVLLRGDATRN